MWPNLALQAITTKPPDDAQVEVALRALKEVLRMEEAAGARQRRVAGVQAGRHRRRLESVEHLSNFFTARPLTTRRQFLEDTVRGQDRQRRCGLPPRAN